jgi:hypothetical protein
MNEDMVGEREKIGLERAKRGGGRRMREAHTKPATAQRVPRMQVRVSTHGESGQRQHREVRDSDVGMPSGLQLGAVGTAMQSISKRACGEGFGVVLGVLSNLLCCARGALAECHVIMEGGKQHPRTGTSRFPSSLPGLLLPQLARHRCSASPGP